ncbi:MAG: hypothetical protein ACI9KE_001712 [Polyangiales bacterium]|jgi:hypothetical protein
MNKKLAIAAGAFAVTLIGAFVALNGRDTETADASDEAPEFPTIERDSITQIDITRPANGDEPATTVTLTKSGDEWRVSAPVDAETDPSAISTALDKLGEMEITGIAASREENYELLEVDDAGILVTVHQGDETVELIVGAYRGLNTMVRVVGEAPVFQVAGSIKYAFNKELKDWRNRRVLGVQADRVRRVHFQSANGDYTFVRNVSGEWEQMEGQEPIERFGSSKVQSIAASVAGMRAVNFADVGVDEAAAGFGTPTGTVTLTVVPEEEEGAEGTPEDPSTFEDIVLHVGAESGSNNEWYVRHVGNPVIYVISTYLADRMRPGTEQFQNPEPGSEPAAAPPGGMPGGMPGMPGGMPGMPGGMPGGAGGMPSGPGGQQIPPELMQQIQQQLQQQQAAGGN